jgi:hypothetical protein
MSRHISAKVLTARDEIVASPAPRACQDHSFELPPSVYGAMATLFLGFVGVLCLALRNPGLAVPFGVFTAFIVAFFAVPAIFEAASPASEARAMRWPELLQRGIAIEHGRCSGKEAAVLVLLLPAFIFMWAIAIAIIVALV